MPLSHWGKAETNQKLSNVSGVLRVASALSEKIILAGEKFDGPYVEHDRMNLSQACQNGHPTRPQAIQNRRRTLWGTLRILMSRERRWGPFSQAC